MTVVINGTTGISPVTASGTSASVDGMTVGRGGGEVATNTAVGAGAIAASTTGAGVTAIGYSALAANTTGDVNTAVGASAMLSTTTGGYNAALGAAALYTNTTGTQNVAVGRSALYSNTTASNNTAVGYQAGYSNTTGYSNSALGQQALYTTTTGAENSAFGRQSMYYNTTGGSNAGYGNYSLLRNTTGNYNTAVGYSALQENTTASNNTAVGYQAGYSNTTGSSYAALGYQAGYSNTTGASNISIGYQAGYSVTTGNYNVFVGTQAGLSTTGSGNTFIGGNAGPGACGYYVTTGSKNTILGAFNGNQNGINITTLNNYVVLSDGDGYPAFWGLGGSSGYMKLEAGRLEFPSTQNPSTGANTLDDYEEGTWTVTLGSAGATSGQTYTSQDGRYVKVGQMVMATFDLRMSNKGTLNSDILIAGLPFASKAGGYYGGGSINYWDTLATSWIYLTTRLQNNGTAVNLSGRGVAGTGIAQLQPGDIANTTVLMGTIMYQTNA